VAREGANSKERKRGLRSRGKQKPQTTKAV
jgi:hypothetical protein